MDLVPLLLSLCALVAIAWGIYDRWRHREEDARVDRKADALARLEQSVKRTAEELKDV